MIRSAQIFFPSIALGAGCLLVSGIREQHTVKSPKPMSAVAARFEGFDGKSLVIDSAEQRVAGMSDYALRTFGPDSNPLFTVYVGYYERQVQGKTIHSPKNCLPGAGWEILSANRIASPSVAPQGTINRVLLANRGNQALVYYWYQGRGRLESSEYKVKWNLLRDAALFGRTEEALVRIVVPIPRAQQGDVAARDEAIKNADALALRVAAPLTDAVTAVLPLAPGT